MSNEGLIVIGAGPAGLALAHHYDGKKLILEREQDVGGLCRSIEIDGAVFDLGGHSFHTPHAEVRAFVETLMAGNWDAQKRDARVWFNGDIIPYPFQTNYQDLTDPNVVAACRATPGGDAAHATNFEEWIYARFGQGVAEHFMLPYNRKLWARDLKKISCEWVGERVAAPATKANAEMKDGKRAPLVPDSRVAYPAHGGFAEIFKTM
ncbi:MAG TPA: NAD(P)-binding protein, partial [Verrucomicrobiae bacterium]|nr:NAD(P)-binding protein [Verrucomicrobiae bacterium]